MSTTLDGKTGKPLVSRRALQLIATAKENVASFDNKLFGEMYVYALEQKVYHGNDAFFRFMSGLERPPVSIEEFLDGEEFIGSTDLILWPEVRKAIIEINQNWWMGGDDAIFECILMGATSVGKSEIARITTLYHIYILSCMKNPQAYYGLPSTTSIVFVIQAAKPHVTKKVLYMPLRKWIEEIPYFQKYMRVDKLIESEIYFRDKNIRVVPGGSDADTILGEAIIGSMIDEINFMAIVQKSKKAEVSTGRAGMYDQAEVIHSAVTRRKKSRFISQGPQIGIICTLSSTRYKGDFTDRRAKQVIDHGEKNVYIYNKKQYDVWPATRYCGETFRLLVGNEVFSETKILREDEEPPAGCMVLDVPIEYLTDFRQRPGDALRDIVGMSTGSVSPFFRRRYKITECVMNGQEAGLESFLVKDNVILGIDGMPQVKRGHYCLNPSKPRYVHIDLSINGDRCGVAMLKYDGMVSVGRGEGGDTSEEMLPKVSVELACSMEPDGDNEIDIAEVRNWVKQLKDIYGYPIKAVTYDGFMSVESQQAWKKQGMKTGHVSVDRTSGPYKQLRDGIYDGRVNMHAQEVLLQELFDLEFDAVKDKVDHPPSGCFVAGTLVETQRGPVPIEEVHIGDAVLSYNAGVAMHPVIAAALTKYTSNLVDVYLANGEVIRCTPEHRFLRVDGTYVEAQYLRGGDDLQD